MSGKWILFENKSVWEAQCTKPAGAVLPTLAVESWAEWPVFKGKDRTQSALEGHPMVHPDTSSLSLILQIFTAFNGFLTNTSATCAVPSLTLGQCATLVPF